MVLCWHMPFAGRQFDCGQGDRTGDRWISNVPSVSYPCHVGRAGNQLPRKRARNGGLMSNLLRSDSDRGCWRRRPSTTNSRRPDTLWPFSRPAKAQAARGFAGGANSGVAASTPFSPLRPLESLSFLCLCADRPADDPTQPRGFPGDGLRSRMPGERHIEPHHPARSPMA